MSIKENPRIDEPRTAVSGGQGQPGVKGGHCRAAGTLAFRAAGLGVAALLVCGDAGAAVLINEVDATNAVGQFPKDFVEFVELVNTGPDAQALDGWTLVFYDGSTDTSYHAIPLDGFAIPAGDHFVVGDVAVANVDLALRPLAGADDQLLRSGNVGVALYSGGMFPDGSGVSTANLVDALVYRVFTAASDAGLAPLLNPGQAQVNENSAGLAFYQSIGRVPDGAGGARNSATYLQMRPTPGAANTAATATNRLVFSGEAVMDKTSIEGGPAMMFTVSVSLNGFAAVPAPSDVTIDFENPDPSEIHISPASVTIPAGQTTAAFTITPVDDGWDDGPQDAFFRGTAPGYAAFVDVITVTDNDLAPAAPCLVINEVHGREAGGDANGSGASDADDEFVEILNCGDADANLNGLRLLSGVTTVYTFPGTSAGDAILRPGCTAVVLANGVISGIGQNPDPMTLEDRFGCALVLSAAGPLGIDDSYGVVRILDGDSEIADFVFHPFGAGSSVRATDGDRSSITVAHPLLGNARFSPGTRQDGTPTPDCNILDVAVSDDCIPENANSPLAMISVTRQGATVGPLSVSLESSDPGQGALGAAQLDYADGESTRATPVSSVRNGSGNGDTQVTFTATQACYQEASASLAVVDLGTIEISMPASLVESSPAVVVTLSRSAPAATSLVLALEARTGGMPFAALTETEVEFLDPDTLSPVTTATIPADASSTTVLLRPVSDADTGGTHEGDQSFEIAATASQADGCANGTAPLTLLDNGGITNGPRIHEFESNPPDGRDTEFIEIRNSSDADIPDLSVYSLVVCDAVTSMVTSVVPLPAVPLPSSALHVVADADVFGGTLPLPDGISGHLPVDGLALPDEDGVIVLVRNPAPAVGAQVDANNLIDAVGYGDSGAVTALLALLSPEFDPVAAEDPALRVKSRAWLASVMAYVAVLPTPGLPNEGQTDAAFVSWLASFGLGGDPAADGDSDQVPALLEYTFGLDPSVPDHDRLPAAMFDALSGELSLTGLLGAHAACDPALVVGGEASFDLADWSTPLPVVDTSVPGQITIRIPVPSGNPAAPAAFLRYVVTLAP